MFPMSFLGPYSPLTGPILEGPRGQNSYFKPRISSTPRFGVWATTQPPDPTLPSRAHHKDYVSRTTSSNYDDEVNGFTAPNNIFIIFYRTQQLFSL